MQIVLLMPKPQGQETNINRQKRKEKSNRLCQTTRTVDFDKSNMEKYNFFSQNKLERDGGTFNFYWFS